MTVMRITNNISTPDAYRRTQFYSGEHLAYYYNPTATASEKHPNAQTSMENSVFSNYLVKKSGLHNISTPSMKQTYYIEKRELNASPEELFQRLLYKDGVHYSAKMYDIQVEQ